MPPALMPGLRGASAWSIEGVGVAKVLPMSLFLGLTHRWEVHYLRSRNSHFLFLQLFLMLFFFPRKFIHEVFSWEVAPDDEFSCYDTGV